MQFYAASCSIICKLFQPCVYIRCVYLVQCQTRLSMTSLCVPKRITLPLLRPPSSTCYWVASLFPFIEEVHWEICVPFSSNDAKRMFYLFLHWINIWFQAVKNHPYTHTHIHLCILIHACIKSYTRTFHINLLWYNARFFLPLCVFKSLLFLFSS